MGTGDQFIDAKFILQKAGTIEGASVADLGCGTGYFIFPASQLVGVRGKVFAVDVLQNTLKKIADRAREEGKTNIVTVWSDLEVFRGAKDIPDNTLDVALIINTLFQAKNREAMMREAARMVKRGGHLLIVEWKLSLAPFGPATAVRVPPDSVRMYGRALHLDEAYSFEAGQYHYGILFKKV